METCIWHRRSQHLGASCTDRNSCRCNSRYVWNIQNIWNCMHSICEACINVGGQTSNTMFDPGYFCFWTFNNKTYMHLFSIFLFLMCLCTSPRQERIYGLTLPYDREIINVHTTPPRTSEMLYLDFLHIFTYIVIWGLLVSISLGHLE